MENPGAAGGISPGKSTGLSRQEQILNTIKESLAVHARSGTFACGGSLPIADSASPNSKAISPIHIRFGKHGSGLLITLPNDAAGSELFEQFLASCQSASFARAGEEAIDGDYRKPGKLDVGEFLTSFCPYQSGIIATIEQLLLPQKKQSKHVRSIRAELYMLNVYSAPSGKFKAHVDTPRSEAQLGSLVASLPVEHTGGELVVRNAGEEVKFDWSESVAYVQWAAFCSDCEHEVLEVKSGHRVTLTYNLYVTRGAGHLAGQAGALDATTLPLYRTLRTVLDSKKFLKNGHVLAIWLTHSYAHTNKHTNFLPDSLKGADMSLYETARALGLHCKVVPVIPKGGYSFDDDYYEEDDYYDEESDSDGERDDNAVIGYGNGVMDLYSSSFHGFNGGQSHNGNLGGGEDETGWGVGMPKNKYTWVNPSDPKLREVQMAYMVYGNDLGSLSVKCSRAAMLIHVPPYKKRGLPANDSENIWADIKKGGSGLEEYPDYSVGRDGYTDGMGGLF